jgi:thiamine-monophosphate kinase
MGSIGLGMMIRRGGARPGDLVFVSGTIGDAGGGLAVLKGATADLGAYAREILVGRYRRPTPRLGLGRLLPPVASASLDVSDGLLADLGHIAEVSAVGIVIEAASIPLAPSLRELWGNSDAAVIRAVTAGDDYELAFTAPAILRERVLAVAEMSGIPVTEIGRVEAGSGVTLLDGSGNRLSVEKAGFTHF